MEDLYQELHKLANSDMYPFHMPGHKRESLHGPMDEFYHLDITEIDGFDNMHRPEGILRDIQQRAAVQFGSEEAWMLVNGSTSGILTALSAVAERGDKILMARNSHKAAYHAVYLNGYQVEYLSPEIIESFGICGGIAPDLLERRLLENPDIKAVFITSPTYDGVVSDVEKIAKIADKANIPLIVDEAHGAHFALDERFPRSAVECGADLVIQSLHKTLPAPTQTALLHLQGGRIRRETLRFYNDIYQTSSPSYLLMAGIGECIRRIEENGKAMCDAFFSNMKEFAAGTRRLKNLRILWNDIDGNRINYSKYGVKDMDLGKIVISCRNTNLNGKELYQLLRKEYHLQLEMAAMDYVTAIATICDTRKGLDRLATALVEIDGKLTVKEDSHHRKEDAASPVASYKAKMRMDEAFAAEKSWIALEKGMGKIAGDFINVYPPGIPLIVPGEEFTEEVLEVIRAYLRRGFVVEGIKSRGNEGKHVEVCIAVV